ncbi:MULTISPECIES: STAS domain-containing protein [Anaerotruncus]|uniref:Anti-sigma factor antagonist n=1 Tax=Anaerotruncus colihominis TaxID=169435 RepID=A0A845RFI7_9FIRM|nr:MULTISPECIES: STAS domain-containing protein [Anaerotruncus]MCI8492068.1 STAS domain-containing protein [Anaerotruncus sp.]MCR2024610.1 STAS domain-containing protein [Anaerotruncus colihominis]NBI78127.1 anti-sigma factor antagonist [Anaerotruncus colihominis]NDO39967.1 STAS domain-containing protein [Anaerotruncus colihominis]
MTINRTSQDGMTVFVLAGRLDTATSPQLHDVLLPAFDGACDILLDFTGLNYVSSAGLRVLLAAQKQSKAAGVCMRLRGVCGEIMEVFDMTGFSDILNIIPNDETR